MNEKQQLDPPKWFRVVGKHFGYGALGVVILGITLTLTALMVKLVTWAWRI